MSPYQLTPAAAADLREIAHYTLRQWGLGQAMRYAGLLEAGFLKIAEGTAISRAFSQKYPQLRVTKCEHHYIFYLPKAEAPPMIIAILHEKRDFINRLKERLS